MTGDSARAFPEPVSILWRRLDRPGHEACRLEGVPGGWRLSGSALFLHEGSPCRLDYAVATDASWNTVSASVEGWVGSRPIRLAIEAGPTRRWLMDGVPVEAVEGCADVDLNFSPSTNLLPIRRLSPEVGREISVRAAWLRFPSFALEPLEQTYRRTGDRAWRYESAGGRFTADLEVEDSGLVTRYPGLCERDEDR
ncbi:MAG: putative glycolipid-binding domain-containing protein [Acidobacteriota bacterium]